MFQTSTPWGYADLTAQIAEGITFHSTPSHGGFLLSHDRRQEMPERLRNHPTFAGGNWYEEDCDAAYVVTAFPQFFTYDQVLTAQRQVDRVEAV